MNVKRFEIPQFPTIGFVIHAYDMYAAKGIIRIMYLISSKR